VAKQPKKPVRTKLAEHLVQYQFVYIPAFIGICYLIFCLCPIYFIPDFCGLARKDEPEKIAETIISVISSILGISLALILIGFEMFKNRLGRIGVSRFLGHRHVIFLVTFQTTVLLYSFLFLIISGKEISNGDLTMLYFLAFLFILSIILLFPLGRNILAEAESHKQIENECERITPKSISELVGYTDGMLDYQKNWQQLDNSPILILRDLGIKYLTEGNDHAPALIIKESTKRFIPFINNKIERRALTEGYNILFITWNGIITEALKKGSFLVLREVVNSVKSIHFHHADNKIELIRTEGLKDFYKRFIDQLFVANQDEILMHAIFAFESVFQKLI
jgi:hypothetical protein